MDVGVQVEVASIKLTSVKETMVLLLPGSDTGYHIVHVSTWTPATSIFKLGSRPRAPGRLSLTYLPMLLPSGLLSIMSRG